VIEINLFEPEQAEAEKLLGYFQMIWVSLETPIPTKTILFNRWCWLYFIIANLFTKDAVIHIIKDS
jgi:hypothetical protein